MRMLKSPDDYSVVFLPFPGDVLAAVRVDADGYPTVYINESLALEARREALRHELRHFVNGDFSNHVTIWDAEKRAAATAPLPAMMASSRRPLTDAEQVPLQITAVKLFAAGFHTPLTFADPLTMPDPLFTSDPRPPLFTSDRR